MQISTFSRYGLRALVRLYNIIKIEGKPVSVKRIAEEENISIKYLENIFSILRRSNLVVAVRGKFGGYKLSKPASEITAFMVIESLEGKIAPVNCILHPEECDNDHEKCTVRPLWQELNQKVETLLKSKNIEELAENKSVSEGIYNL